MKICVSMPKCCLRKAVYKKNKVKIPMVHFFPILQITFLAFVIRKHEKAFVYGGIGTEI